MRYSLKECTKCGISKPEDAFPRQGKGSLTYCRTCRHAQIRDARLNSDNRDYHKEYYQKNKEKISESRKRELQTNADYKFKHMFRNSKQRAHYKGLTFDLSSWEFLKELWFLQQGRCAISGEEMSLSGDILSNKVSLDRIDSARGYEEGNLQLVTIKVNYMKRDMDQNTFLDLCRRIASAV